MVLENKKYVVGIDFGAVSSGLSIAHVNRPHSKFTVNTWNGESYKSEPGQFLTTILYKANGDIHCGISKHNDPLSAAPIDEEDVYIDNIKQYTLNIDQANEELEQKMEGLTIQKVVTDYLKTFHALAIKCLKEHKDFRKSYKFEDDFKLENLGYCLSCPTFLNDFFADCFMEAEIITEKDNLVFLSEAEATAFHCLSLDRLITKIIPDQTYLVCDIGHSSFGVSKIKADSTENFSEVELISEEIGKGSMVLENSFKNYLIENKSKLKLNESIISKLVEIFVKELKSSFHENGESTNIQQVNEDNKEEEDDETDFEDDFDEDNFDDEDTKSSKPLEFILQESSIEDESSDQVDNLEVGQEQEEENSPLFHILDVNNDPINITTEDLGKYVFSPYLDYLVNYIMKVDRDNNNDSNIFLSGKYSSDANFFEKLSGGFSKLVSLIEDTNIDAVSLGAVSSGLKAKDKDVQIPFFSATGSKPSSSGSQNENIKDENESNKKSKDDFDFIVGIDFGTTFTGCSYADPKDPHANDIKYIHTIETGWPGGNAISYGKTPTLLMYDKHMKTKLWGQEAKQNVERYRDLSLLGNFKLFLSPEAVDAQYGEGNPDIKKMKEDYDYKDPVICVSQVPYKPKKGKVRKSVDAVQVIADYLREVKDHVIRHIIAESKFKKDKKGFTRFFKSSGSEPKLQFVLTVPAMWTTSARETMAQAAIKATIIKKEELDELLIISEPEAAALFCEKKYSNLIRDPKNPDIDSNFIVCDAGGGTVDLVTFRLTRNQETGDPMICQIGSGIGDTCGSTYLDKAFKDYLLGFYKDIGLEVNEIDTRFDSTMDEFISNIKCNFMPDSANDRYCEVKLPAERRITNIPNTPEAKQYNLIERNTKLKITHADIKEKIFDHIIKKILVLIQQQLDQALKSGSDIKAILLVGGFSRNPYLQQRIQNEYTGRYDVKIPEEGVAAISKGAVSYGLNPRLISGKFAGQSIALEVRTPFDKSDGSLNSLDKKVDRSGNKVDRYGMNVDGESIDEVYSKNRLEYFVRQSDALQGESLKLFNRSVIVDYPNNAVIAVFACDFKEEKNEEHWKYVSRKHAKILEEVIKLPEVEGINKGDPILFNVGLKMDDIGATVTIKCQNRLINSKIYEMTKGKKTTLEIVRKCDLIVVKNKKPLPT
ncbi:hypothetical protein BDF21DRAFT_491033 [Thamnidium elegans]|nr:hypothetical protein BDF21DRAFT_491033 [Thamnidium elegans]